MTQDQNADTLTNTDMLSRLPLKEGNEIATEEPVFHTMVLEQFPVSAEQIAEMTRKDPLCSKVWTNTFNGWPNHVNDAKLQFYFKRLQELSGGGLVLVIPTPLKRKILGEWRAPRNFQDEGSRQDLCLVAWHQHINNSQVMPGLQTEWPIL